MTEAVPATVESGERSGGPKQPQASEPRPQMARKRDVEVVQVGDWEVVECRDRAVRAERERDRLRAQTERLRGRVAKLEQQTGSDFDIGKLGWRWVAASWGKEWAEVLHERYLGDKATSILASRFGIDERTARHRLKTMRDAMKAEKIWPKGWDSVDKCRGERRNVK